MSVTGTEPVIPPALIARVKAILMKPKDEWAVIEAEPATIQGIYKSYLVYLAALSPVARFIGDVAFRHAPIMASAVAAALSYGIWLVGTYLMALLIDTLAPQFGGERSMVQAFKVAAYSTTASAVAGIFAIIPWLAFFAILGLYGLYLLWLGLPRLMKVPQEKALTYYACLLVVLLGLGLLISLLLGPLLAPSKFGL